MIGAPPARPGRLKGPASRLLLLLHLLLLLGDGADRTVVAQASPWPRDWAWQAMPIGPPLGEVAALSLVGDTLLLRLEAAGEPGSAPQVMALDAISGRRRLGPSPLTEFIAAQRPWVLAQGSRPGFWLVDIAGRIWSGPSYHDGRRWVVLAKSGTVGAAQLSYARDGLLDAEGQVWVPYRLEPAVCPDPGACVETGLQGFGPEGPRQRVLPLGAPNVGGELGARDWSLLQVRGEAWALGPRWALRPPDAKPLTYPYLGEPDPGALRHAGYASAAWDGLSGGPRVALWVELQEPAGPRPIDLVLSWDRSAAAWRELPMTDCPLLVGQEGSARITAGAEGRMAGEALLWLGSTRGAVAVQGGDRWWSWTAGEAKLAAAAVRHLAYHGEGGVWASAGASLARFGPPLAAPAATLHLPALSR